MNFIVEFEHFLRTTDNWTQYSNEVCEGFKTSEEDAASLTKNDAARGIDGEKWIMESRLKTGVVENVPLLPIPLTIIEKYMQHKYCKIHGILLPVKSNQRYNAYLKESRRPL